MATLLLLFIPLCLFVLIVIAVVLFFGFVLIKVPENEKWVVTRQGTTSVKGPGRFIRIPFIDKVNKVDISENPTKFQDQACITKDMVPVIIQMIIYSRPIEPIKYSALTRQRREDFMLLSSSTLKEIISTRLLDEVLSARDKVDTALCDKLNADIDPGLGIRIEKVKLIDIVVSKKILASMAVATANVPAECPACGAPMIPGRGVKGKDQIKCEYCGYLIKL